MTKVNASLKYGKGYNDPWVTFEGESVEDVKQKITEATGMSGEGISLAQLVVNASSHFQAMHTVATVLGGTVVPETTASEPSSEPEPQAQAAAPEPDPQASVESDILAKLAECKTKADVGNLYMKNKAAIDGTEGLKEKVTSRAKEL